ncbi:Aspartic proteinase nepenthesin-1 [Triticum urartu]|uniref:Aspartic proteinase nepenthesin-1 n=1 Tax=Triticum urartu TaxID=4572 RepID=M7YUZ2_TRIUA|nr:Aspartic proteinase nepenthesin-1 [Triticum urartu]
MAIAMPAPAAACSLLLLLLVVAAPVAAGNPKIDECVIHGVRWAAWADSEQLTEGLGIPERTFSAFIFDLSVGRQALSVVMDISSELVWVQCSPGLRPTPTFLPDHSGSFAPVAPCPSFVRNNSGSFGQIHYADRTCNPGDHGCEARCGYVENIYGAGNTSGYLATDRFGLGNTKVSGMVFGCSCSHNVTMLSDLDGASGFVGFSRGPLSLVSQLQISRFSYFTTLPGDPDNSKAFVSLSWAADHADAKGSHTPLLAARPNQNSYLYYVNLTGLQVDGQLLTDIPAGTFDVRANGSGGVFLSTTLPFTYLDEPAYKVLRRELVSRVRSQGLAPVNATAGHSLCFLTQHFSKLKVPKLALVFDGADATMELRAQNYFWNFSGGQTCLTILPSTTGRSILGSQLQTGRTMTYDIHGDGGGQLTFSGAPAPAQVSLATLLLIWVLLL